MTESVHPIREWRHAQNPRVPLSDLAQKVGITKGYLSRIETGSESLTVEIGQKVSLWTGIPMRVLFPELAKMFEAAE